jgi:hypothetical protein
MRQSFDGRLGIFKVARLGAGVVAGLVLPRAAYACPVCFGQSDSPMALAMNAGIFAMLGVVAAVLVAFAMFFVRLARGERLAASAESGGAVEQLRNSYSHTDPREGTAQC